MPKVNRLIGKHLFPSVELVRIRGLQKFCFDAYLMYVDSWHIEIGYQTPLVFVFVLYYDLYEKNFQNSTINTLL